MKVLLLIVIAIIGYILGGFNGAILTSQYVFHDDIRKHGSGTQVSPTFSVPTVLRALYGFWELMLSRPLSQCFSAAGL